MANTVTVKDLTTWKTIDLNINWEDEVESLERGVNKLLRGKKEVKLDNTKGDIRELLPLIERKGKWIQQTRYDYSTAKKEEDYGKIISGFPLKDEDRHYKLRRKCGSTKGRYIGFK